jgi:hypothetical protein
MRLIRSHLSTASRRKKSRKLMRATRRRYPRQNRPTLQLSAPVGPETNRSLAFNFAPESSYNYPQPDLRKAHGVPEEDHEGRTGCRDIDPADPY